MFEYLKTLIPLRQTKKKSVWVSNVCPFTGYVSERRPFRINLKLGVCKCYHCGGSAKELYFLKLRIENPDKAEIESIKHDPFLKYCRGGDRMKAKLIQDIKDKASAKHDAIVKSEWDDLGLPF